MIVHFINLYGYLEKDYIAQKCLESWKKYMPDAEIKIWTENDDFMKDILNKKIKFLEYANEKKNKIPIAMLCDYLKLKIIYEFGGMISEFDQILVKSISIDEEVEFCDMLLTLDTITSEHLPYYFKKRNKILKYLIDEIENNFSEDWLEKNNSKFYHGRNELSLCYLRNLPSDLFKDLIKLKEDSAKIIDEIGYFAVHISNWWMYRFNKIFISYGFDIFNQYKDFVDDDTYFVIIDGESKYPWRLNNRLYKVIGISYKDLFIKSVKYEISKSPELKNKFIDINNILGDLNNISFKDFEL
jgi:hypothetical protein